MSTDDKLAHFATRVVALQEERQATVDEDTMRQVALELGMSDEDILRAKAEGETRKQRARTLRSQSLVDEAIEELETVHAFNPLDADGTLMLADALFVRARKKADAQELVRARQLCLEVIQAAPANTDAAALLNAIKNNPAETQKASTGVVVAIALAIGLMMLAVAYLLVG